METSIANYVLGKLSINYMLAFYFFAIFGMLFTMVLHYRKKSKKQSFNFSYWILDNWVRILGNLMAVFIVLRFANNIMPQQELNMWLGFLVGFSIDAVIIGIRKYTKINLFQKK